MRCGAVILEDDREANKAWCVDRQELFLYLTSQLLQDKHTWTYRPGLKESDVCTLLLTQSILGLPAWIRAGYKGIGEVRLACLFLLVKSKCFLDSGVRHCCKVGHSCVRRVIDCSSVPHKMAWCSVARAIRAVARFGGPRCGIFDISQLRPAVDRMFQELDTAPARCCWRCGLPLAGLSLITADIDQAFEALVKIYPGPSWSSRIMQTWEITIVWSWMAFVLHSCPCPGSVQFHVRLPCGAGFHGVANPGYSDWWCNEFCRSCCFLIGPTTGAFQAWLQFPGATDPQLYLMEEMCGRCACG